MTPHDLVAAVVVTVLAGVAAVAAWVVAMVSDPVLVSAVSATVRCWCPSSVSSARCWPVVTARLPGTWRSPSIIRSRSTGTPRTSRRCAIGWLTCRRRTTRPITRSPTTSSSGVRRRRGPQAGRPRARDIKRMQEDS